MLTNLTLENYKVFRELNNLKIKPITVLCGANSCGKSTIIQSMLLLKQTFESRQTNSGILLNGRWLHVGFPQSIVHKRNLDNEMKLEFTFRASDVQKEIRNVATIFFRAFRKSGERVVGIKIKFTIVLQWKKIENKKQRENLVVKKWRVELKPVFKNNNAKEFTDMYKRVYNFEHVQQRNYKFMFNEKDNSYNCKLSVRFFGLFPSINSSSFNIEDNKDNVEKINEILLDLYFLKETLNGLWKSVRFIGPLREEPSRRYIYDNEVTEIGIKGENSAYIYVTEDETKIDKVFFYSKDTGKYENKGQMKLSEAVDLWLSCMGVENFKTEYNQDIIYLNMNATPTDDTEVNIADVGFGVSQVLPIVLEGLRMGDGNTLLLEQPEIHLHPGLQMQLADYFIASALSKKNYIIETHSEHLINRFVRRIMEDDTGKIKDLIGVYFIELSADGAVVREVKIDEKAGIVNWPDGFFDQASDEQEKIMMAKIKHFKRMK